MYDGECGENFKKWLFATFGTYAAHLLQNLRSVNGYEPDRKALFSAEGHKYAVQTESEYEQNWGGFLEYKVTGHWIMSVFVTDKNVIFFLASREESCYKIISFYPCGAGGAYGPAPLKCDIKVLNPNDLNTVRTIRCKEVEYDSSHASTEEPYERFVPADDGEFVKVFCKKEMEEPEKTTVYFL